MSYPYAAAQVFQDGGGTIDATAGGIFAVIDVAFNCAAANVVVDNAAASADPQPVPAAGRNRIDEGIGAGDARFVADACGHHGDHAHAHVERALHLGLLHAPGALHEVEDRQRGPRRAVEPGGAKIGLADGSEGELRIRGPQLFDGYTDTQVTVSQFDDEGWFYPGDVGVVDDGWIRMTGRTKDIVNRGGEKFSTQDIEHALLSHVDIVAASVTSVPDERFGEAVGAWVVLGPGTPWEGPQRYLQHLESLRLARAKLPVEWHVVETIPTSASGKVQKFRLRELPDLATAEHVRLN